MTSSALVEEKAASADPGPAPGGQASAPIPAPPDAAAQIAALTNEVRELRAAVGRLEAELERRCGALEAPRAAAAAPRPPNPTAQTTGVISKMAASVPFLNDLITVKSSDPDDDPNCTARNVISPLPAVFCSDDAPGQWISVTFMKTTVAPVAYFLKSINAAEGSIHPRGWVLEGSEHELEWVVLDEQRDTSILNGPNRRSRFQISGRHPAFRTFRLTMTQENHSGNNVFALAFFDIERAPAEASRASAWGWKAGTQQKWGTGTAFKAAGPNQGQTGFARAGPTGFGTAAGPNQGQTGFGRRVGFTARTGPNQGQLAFGHTGTFYGTRKPNPGQPAFGHTGTFGTRTATVFTGGGFRFGGGGNFNTAGPYDRGDGSSDEEIATDYDDGY